MWIPVLLVASLITLYIGSYALNKSTPIPEACLEDIDTSKCSSCNIASCNFKE